MTKYTLERLCTQDQRSILFPQAGFMNDGRILALDVEHYNNAGAFLDESLFVSVLMSKCTFWKVLRKMI